MRHLACCLAATTILSAAEPVLRSASGAAAGTRPIWTADSSAVLYARALEPDQEAGELRILDLERGGERSFGRVPYQGGPRSEPRATQVMQPLAVDATLRVVWVGCGGRGLWVWRPVDGGLVKLHPEAESAEAFRASQTISGGPEGRVAFVDRWSDRVALAAGDGSAVEWLPVVLGRKEHLAAPLWWRGQLVAAQDGGAARLLWPSPAGVDLAGLASALPANPRVALSSWDPGSGGMLVAEVPGGLRQPLLAPQAGAARLRLLQARDQLAWTRSLADGDIRERLRQASKAERANPQGIGTGAPVVHESAVVVSYRHPLAVLRFDLEVRYGFVGHVYTAFARYDVAADRLEPLGDSYRYTSSGVNEDGGDLPTCSPAPDARGVAFRVADTVVVLR